MSNQKAVTKGEQYQALKVQLDDVFLTLEQSYMDQLIESAMEDDQLRNHIYHRIRVLKDFMRVIDLVIADGKVARADIIRVSKIDSGAVKPFF